MSSNDIKFNGNDLKIEQAAEMNRLCYFETDVKSVPSDIKSLGILTSLQRHLSTVT